MKTYLIYIRTEEGAQKPLKIKADGHTVHSDRKLVQFEDKQGNVVAIFNIAELVGFVEADHVVS